MTKSGRIKSLQWDMSLAIKKVAKGTPQYFRMRQYILTMLISDLKDVNHLVPSLSSLREDIVKKLVALWVKRGNCTKTIVSKLSIIRKICQAHCPELIFPSNQALNLNYRRAQRESLPVFVELEKIVDPTIRYYCTLQYVFGLTKYEALLIRGYMFQGEALRLPRKITYNHHDRAIQIQTEQQRQWRDHVMVAAETTKSKRVAQIKIHGKLFTNELKRLGIADQNYYRHHYIQKRHQALLQAGYPLRAVYQQLRQETGYQSNKPLREILKCLKNS